MCNITRLAALTSKSAWATCICNQNNAGALFFILKRGVFSKIMSAIPTAPPIALELQNFFRETSAGDSMRKHESSSGSGGSAAPLSARCGFGWLAFMAELLMAASLALVLFWVFNYHNGVAWSGDGSKQMNLHYVLMIAGFTFMNGHSMLVYRTFPCCRKVYVKVLHALLFVGAIACICCGMFAAIDAHNDGPAPVHFYSMHSWIGLVACGLFGMQFLFGVFAFLVLLCCDGATAKFRAAMIPTHVTIGLVTFTIATAASLTGLMQSARYRLSGKDGKPDYKDLEEQGIIVNVLGMCLVALLIVIPYIIRNSNYRRYTTLTIN